ncbi:MAG: lipase family alpha/beta hydrolase [Burkholderiaceae bacterium]
MRLTALLRLSLAVQVGGGALLAAWWLPDGTRPWVAFAIGFAVPPAAHAAVLAVEFAIAAAVDPRRPRASLPHVLAVWLRETSASLRAFAWRMPFLAGFAEPSIERDRERPAVLLVHGYLCNRAVWKPWLDAGGFDGCSVATLDLVPPFGDLDDYADPLHAAVERLRAASGAAQIVVVAHSMGGLALRCYLRRYGGDAVARAITIASPHHGTLLARFGHGRNARQMRPGSQFLRTLAAGENAAMRAKFVCIATRDDNLIVPRTSPLLDGARHHVLDGVGHLASIEDRRVWAIVEREIRTARRVPAHAQASRGAPRAPAAGEDRNGSDAAAPG